MLVIQALPSSVDSQTRFQRKSLFLRLSCPWTLLASRRHCFVSPCFLKTHHAFTFPQLQWRNVTLQFCWAPLNIKHVLFFPRKWVGFNWCNPAEGYWPDTAELTWSLAALFYIVSRWARSLSLSHYLKRARSRRWRTEGKTHCARTLFPYSFTHFPL